MKLILTTNGKEVIYYICRIYAPRNNRYVSCVLSENDKRFNQRLEGEIFINMLTIDILKSSFEIVSTTGETIY